MASRSRCVAAMSRNSTRRSWTSPRRRQRISSTAFRSFAWTCRSTSPISSRKSVPRWASSMSPGFAATAPVKAPFWYPKSSLSSSSREKPAQLRSTKGCAARGPLSCSQRARTPLPLPVSPWMRTGVEATATRAACSESRRTTALSPRNGSGRRRSVRLRPASLTRRSRRTSMSRSTITQQRRELDGLRQEVLGALLDRLDREVDRAVSGQDQDRHGGVLALQAAQELETVSVRERVVEKHDVGCRRVEDLGRLRAAPCGQHLVALADEEQLERPADGRLVVDDQQTVRHRARRLAGSRAGRP